MKKAVVTGGASGIGAAIVEALKAVNVDPVYVVDTARGTDVTNYDQVARHFAAIGNFDVLVNCAGICMAAPFGEMAPSQWERTVAVNLIGAMNCCHAALPYIKGGDIINIASRAGAYGHANLAAYCASKAGVMAFSEALALDLRKMGIRVGYLMPGTVATGLGGVHEPAEWQIQPSDIGRAVVGMINLPRRASFGRVEIKPSFPE